jgi:hypothetical protein
VDHNIKNEEKKREKLNQIKNKVGPGKKRKERIKKNIMFFRERKKVTG